MTTRRPRANDSRLPQTHFRQSRRRCCSCLGIAEDRVFGFWDRGRYSVYRLILLVMTAIGTGQLPQSFWQAHIRWMCISAMRQLKRTRPCGWAPSVTGTKRWLWQPRDHSLRSALPACSSAAAGYEWQERHGRWTPSPARPPGRMGEPGNNGQHAFQLLHAPTPSRLTIKGGEGRKAPRPPA